jgi:hypothetical protein
LDFFAKFNPRRFDQKYANPKRTYRPPVIAITASCRTWVRSAWARLFAESIGRRVITQAKPQPSSGGFDAAQLAHRPQYQGIAQQTFHKLWRAGARIQASALRTPSSGAQPELNCNRGRAHGAAFFATVP